jgi:hypothetical protein
MMSNITNGVLIMYPAVLPLDILMEFESQALKFTGRVLYWMMHTIINGVIITYPAVSSSDILSEIKVYCNLN